MPAPRSEHAGILAEVYAILLRAAERVASEQEEALPGKDRAAEGSINDGTNITAHSQEF